MDVTCVCVLFLISSFNTPANQYILLENTVQELNTRQMLKIPANVDGFV